MRIVTERLGFRKASRPRKIEIGKGEDEIGIAHFRCKIPMPFMQQNNRVSVRDDVKCGQS
jgi:hypothetical protein